MVRLFFLCLALLVLTSGTFAGSHPSSSRLRPTHFLQAGVLLHSYDYSEAWAPPAKSNELGWIGGADLRYTYHGAVVPLFGRVHLEFVEARTNYDGGLTLTDGRHVDFSSLTKNIFKRIELNLGFCLNSIGGVPLDLITYSGFGYRFWRRNLAFGLPADYIEDYSWKYLPVGIRGEYTFGTHWSVALDVALQIMFGGRLDIMEQFGDPSFTLGSVTGSKIALPVNFQFGGPWGLTLEPWIEFSGIEESNIVVTQFGHQLHEPSSRSHLFGFTFSAGVRL